MGAYARLALLFLSLTAIFVVFGWAIGSYFFGDPLVSIILFLVLAAGINLVSYALSDRIVLWSYRAKMVTEPEAPKLFAIVREVAIQANLPMPKVAIVPSQTPNAPRVGIRSTRSSRAPRESSKSSTTTSCGRSWPTRSRMSRTGISS